MFYRARFRVKLVVEKKKIVLHASKKQLLFSIFTRNTVYNYNIYDGYHILEVSKNIIPSTQVPTQGKQLG